MEHEHSWYFTFGPGRWSATCGACGLAVAVEERGEGRSGWEWTQDGAPAPPDVRLAAIGSVQRARRALLTRHAGGEG